MNHDNLLPYLIIARICGLVKEHPQNDADRIWLDEKGKRFVITYLGFAPAEQYNYKLLCERTQRELEQVSADYVAMKKQLEEIKEKSGLIPQTDVLGKRSKKYILSIIKVKTMTAEEKLETIETQLRKMK